MTGKMSRIVPALLFGGLLALTFPAPSFAHGDTAAGGETPASPETPDPSAGERQVEPYHTLAEKKAAGRARNITDRITISGLIEVEAAAENVDFADGTADAASDLTLATAQIALGVKLTERVRGNISLLFEEGAFGDEDTDLEVDEAAVDIYFPSLFGRFGRLYLPFGVYHSHFISDPLTLALGETRETALLLGYGHDLFSLSAFVFNGDAGKIGQEDQIDDWGASLVLTPAEGIELGGSYLADLADSDAGLLAEYRRRVGGWSSFATVEHGPFGASAEILGGVQSFDAADLDADGNGKGDRPLAWNLEVSWAPVEQVEVAARYEGSDEFAGQPERQYGVAVSWSLWEDATLSLEYLRGRFDQDFSADEEGNVPDRRELLGAQLAFEF
ncbi:hypothetical protein DSOUD_2326 [Desulfuromonas soudanensis]|uniref:Phosphate-selective porin O and P n=1 Tax=Desulfuromonas soudanensis TaxID=1603606 RepID=A0A0M3QFZ4_9BACT|nr:LbtU family siderophore porin [Desulfuromonas soudanensis]ALC17089.1 hypothetical protein DSOUD_2326 [Desulfuromonas soudanensis]